MRKLINNWRYYRLGKEEYLLCIDRVLAGNLQSLSFVNIWFGILVFVSGVMAPSFWYATFPIAGVSAFSAIWMDRWHNQNQKGRHFSKKVIYRLVVSFYSFIMLSSLYLFVWLVPGTSVSIMFYIILICAIFTIVAPPSLGLGFTLISSVLFASTSFYLKELEIFIGDITMLTAVVPAAITFNWFSNMYKFRAMLNEIRLEGERDKFRQASTVDELTGLRNRRDFNTTFHRFLNNRRGTDAGRFVCLALLDIDHFKEYNDHYGHLVGDECLQNMGKALKDLRDSADVYVARVGGEEFAILWFEQDTAGIQKIVQEVHLRIKELAIPHKKSSTASYVTVSMGVYAVNSDTQEDTDAIYSLADKALYEAKEKGRNCAVVYANIAKQHLT